MARTVPVSSSQAPGNFITGALWNAGPAASNTFLTTVPMAVVYQTASQNLTIATWTAIAQDSTLLDTDSQHSNSVNNSRLVAQIAGWYSVSGAVAFSTNTAGSRGAGIYKNGAVLTNASGIITAASNVTHVAVTGEVPVQMSVGDYVELYGWQNASGTLATNVGVQYDSYLYFRWEHA